MSELKPILFNTEMVRALLDGRKTQTRRVVKPQPKGRAVFGLQNGILSWGEMRSGICYEYKAKAPYRTGDVLYVRETWRKVCATERYYECGEFVNSEELFGYMYRADNFIRWDEREPKDDEFHLSDITREVNWHPSIHMPKEAARIFLRVTDVRVERLQHITRDGAISEGCNAAIPILEFQGIWDTTIKSADRDRYGWNANPWVWVICFERIPKKDAE